MHQTCQELIKRQGNKPEKDYIEPAQGTPVWVQHRQNATLEPAIVVNQCALNSYWIMQENGTEQPKVYRYTRAMLKIRSTPTEGKQTAQMKEWMTESRKSESNIPAIPNMIRGSVHENSQENTSSDSVQPPLPRLDLPKLLLQKTGRKLQNHCVQMNLHWRHLIQMDKIHHIHQGLVSQQERTLESQPSHLVIFTCKDTITPGSVNYQLKMLNFKLYIYIKARLVQNMTNLQYLVQP